jgi:FixJ family two-component response regulator
MRALGFPVAVFASAAEFLASPELHDTGCLIADIHMPSMSGIELHARLKAAGHAIPTILVTADPDEVVWAQAANTGIIGCLRKPLDKGMLVQYVQLALARGRFTGKPS